MGVAAIDFRPWDFGAGLGTLLLIFVMRPGSSLDSHRKQTFSPIMDIHLTELVESGAEAASQVLSLVRGIDGLRQVEIVEALKFTDRTQIFHITSNLGDLVAKQDLSPRAHRWTEGAWEEFQDLRSTMLDGASRVVEVLFARPERGLLVTRYVPGQRLVDALSQADDMRRAELMARAGGWVQALSAVRTRTRTRNFGADYWVKLARGRGIGALDPEGLTLRDALIKRMAEQAPSLRGAPVEQVKGHGDLSGNNLIVSGPVITGVDLNGTAYRPRSFDAVKLLQSLDLSLPELHRTSEPTSGGVSQTLAAPFLATGVLPQPEREVLFGFFACENLVGHLTRRAA
ncbi:MAG: phosphotransferase, partial [Pseudomonadota bacterium]